MRKLRRQFRLIESFKRQGKAKHAEKSLQRLLIHHPHLAQAYFELGQLNESQPGALDYYQHAIYFNSRLAEAWYRLGILYEQNSMYVHSLAAFGMYLRLRPNTQSAAVYTRLAQALSNLKYEGSAIQFYLKALEQDQSNPLVLYSLALSLQKMGDLDLALECLMTIGKMYPQKLDLVSLLMGHLLEKQSEVTAAIQCYQEAVDRQPRQLFWQLKRDLVYAIVPEDSAEIARSQLKMQTALETTLQRLKHQPIQLPREHFFYLAMMHGNIAYTAYQHQEPLLQRRLFARLIESALPRMEVDWLPSGKKSHGIHLGILVAPKSIALAYIYSIALADQLDPEQFQVTLFCSSLEITQLFQLNQRLSVKGKHMHWKLISDDVYVALRQIRATAIDVMWFTEPGWDFHQYTLALLRVAPVQCTSWMNPGSSGLSQMDYFLSCEQIELPEADQHYTEKLERWEHYPSWVPYFEFPETLPRSEFGLEDQWHLYACLQNLLKFHPDFDDVVADILRRDPLGHLIMVSSPEREHLTGKLMKRFERRIPDVMSRIWVFPELSNHLFLQLMQNCDVVLDPLHYGGGTTTYQAIALGLPIVTCPGQQMVARITAALCRSVGMTEGLVANVQDYALKAIALAENPELRQQINSRTQANLGQLYQDARSVSCLSEFLTRACRSNTNLL